MTEQQIINVLTQVSPLVAFLIVLIFGIRGAPNIIDKWGDVEKIRNEGKQQDVIAQSNIVAAATKSVETAVKAMQDTQAQSREFYVSKLEDMRTGMKILEDRIADQDKLISDLQEQVMEEKKRGADKDKRIAELEREVASLRHENDGLRSKGNGKSKKPVAKESKP